MVLQEIKQSGYAESAKSGVVITVARRCSPALSNSPRTSFVYRRAVVCQPACGVVELVNSPMYATGSVCYSLP